LFDQITIVDNEIKALQETSAGFEFEYLREFQRVEDRYQREMTLFGEGFFTGTWFRKFNLD
jgi:hypothetical protein